jgi:hypothetical protein
MKISCWEIFTRGISPRTTTDLRGKSNQKNTKERRNSRAYRIRECRLIVSQFAVKKIQKAAYG